MWKLLSKRERREHVRLYSKIKNERTDNWKTPKDFYTKLNDEFNFDFDPCPFFVGDIPPEKDGLLIDWGKRNFVNPPYSIKLKTAFIQKAIKEKERGNTSVVLIPAVTGTRLFHDIIVPNAKEIRFVKGRIKFEGISKQGKEIKGKPCMHDSMIIVFEGKQKEDV